MKNFQKFPKLSPAQIDLFRKKGNEMCFELKLMNGEIIKSNTVIAATFSISQTCLPV